MLKARRYAAAYLDEIGGNYQGKVAQSLQRASLLYKKELDSLTKLSQIFPFMGSGKAADIKDPQVREQAAKALRQALKWESQAVGELESAAKLWEAGDRKE